MRELVGALVDRAAFRQVVKAAHPEHQGSYMSIGRGRILRAIPQTLGALTVLTLVPLLIWDTSPERFPERAHDSLAALPLALIALAWVLHRATRRSPLPELGKAFLLGAAFLFWAANQFWPDQPLATMFNDVAIALFVVDVFLAMRERPTGATANATGEPSRLPEGAQASVPERASGSRVTADPPP
jgi:hypothetical protein